jgi:hypothetical protein
MNMQKHETMKTTRLYTLVALLMVFTISCNKLEDQNNGGNDNGGNNGGGNQINHEYVDLGLPSGTLWATCNVGADMPEDYGDYFAWGETNQKDFYDWNTYKYCNGDYNKLTKYCSNPNFGDNNFTDNLTVLQPADDAASISWGNDWRTPTQAQWQELENNISSIWTTLNGVNGRLFTANNGNSIFFPAAGFHSESSFNDISKSGRYWSSSLITGSPSYAWHYGFGLYTTNVNGSGRRYDGQSIRPVRSSK